MNEPRFEVIEGQRTLIVETRPPLPPKLDALLSAMPVLSFREDIRPTGARVECDRDRDHRFARFREGRHLGLDGIVRDLSLAMCRDCGAVRVSDISRDRLAGLSTGGQALRRRDHVIGWYTGARPRQRTHL